MNHIITDMLTERADSAQAPPIDPAALIGRARRRRRTTRGLGVIVAAGIATTAVVVVPAMWSDSVEDTTPVGPANPVEMDPWGPWIEGTTLHLGSTDVEVQDVKMLVAVPDGAVYGTADGDVVWARADGTTATIGSDRQRYSPIVTAADTTWVTWVEGGTTNDPEAVVFDIAAGEERARTDIAADGDRASYLTEVGGQPVGIDEGVVYLRTLDGDYGWDVAGNGRLFRVLPDGPGTEDHYLIARGDLTDVVQLGSGEDPTRIGDVEIAGNGFLLSPSSRYLLGEPLEQDKFAIWDTTTGARVDDLLPAALTHPLSVVFESPDVITYALPGEGGTVDIVSCDLVSGDCETSLPATDKPVMFANGLVL